MGLTKLQTINFSKGLWHGYYFFLFYVDYGNKLSTCVLGPWQWPMRGYRIGEASHPGPPHMSREQVARMDAEADILPPSAAVPEPSHFGLPVEFHSQTQRERLSQQRPKLRCPLCTGVATNGPVRGLILHMATRHCGEAIVD